MGENKTNNLKKEVILVLFGMTILIFGYLLLSKNLFSGPRMADENQIFKLQIELAEDGFFETLKNEIVSRLGMRRLVPVYNVQKVVLAKLFGPNMLLWSIYGGIIGVIGGTFLYLFGRKLNFSVFNSLVLSLVTIFGEQSVLWWRILHGEGIGLASFSIGLYFLAENYHNKILKNELLSLLFVSIAALSKESFILALPGVALLKMFLPYFFDKNITIKEALLNNKLFVITSAIVCLSLVGIIKYGFETTSFQYTGWVGFKEEYFEKIIKQFSEITRFGYVITSIFVALVLLPSIFDSKKEVKSLLITLAPILLISAAFIIPQLLLYMSSGFYNQGAEANYARYLIPCMFGYGLLVSSTIRLIQLSGVAKAARYAVFLIPILYLSSKANDAFQRAKKYEMYTSINDAWFESVTKNVDPKKAIVISFLNGAEGGYSLQAALRVYYILNQGYGYENIYFSPFPEKPSFEESRKTAIQADTKRHSAKMKHFSEIKDKKTDIGALMILNWGEIATPDPNQKIIPSVVLEHNFKQLNKKWFKPKDYIRIPNGHKHITYVKKNQN